MRLPFAIAWSRRRVRLEDELTVDGQGSCRRQNLVRTGLRDHLARLWRYGLVLSGRREVADDLVQSTCVRALERAEQFQPGTHLDRWLFSILHSIWLNEVRARQIRQGAGFVDAETTLSFDGASRIEATIMAAQIMREVQDLPEAQRSAVFLVYVEGLSYREAADVLAVPIGTIMSRLAAARETLGRRTGEATTRGSRTTPGAERQ